MIDIISDTRTRIINALSTKAPEVFLYTPLPKICFKILDILYKEGYIRGYSKSYNLKKRKIIIKVLLKYNYDGTPSITYFKRISTAGRRIFTSVKPLWQLNNGAGLLIISTPKGLMTDKDARLLNCGGEIMFYIK